MSKGNNNGEHNAKSFRLTLTDEAARKEIRIFRFSGTGVWVAAVSTVVLAILASFCLIAFTPLKNFIPGYPDSRARKQTIENKLRIDSLTVKLHQWEFYASNLKRVLRGEEGVHPDSLFIQAGRLAQDDSAALAAKAGRDSALRSYIKEKEQFEIAPTPRSLPIEGILFYTPVKGVISKGFTAKIHPWTDISAPEGSVVKAVLDGTVIEQSWSETSLWTITIQHPDNIISVSRNNMKPLASVGDKVKGGGAIGMLGTPPGETSSLSFSLWYKGEAVDAARFISF